VDVQQRVSRCKEVVNEARDKGQVAHLFPNQQNKQPSSFLRSTGRTRHELTTRGIREDPGPGEDIEVASVWASSSYNFDSDYLN
jgi:hypothetical protein